VVAFSTRLQVFRVRVTDGADGSVGCELLPQEAATQLAVADTKCLAFSADGSRLAVGSEDGRLRVFTWPQLQRVADVAGAHPDALSDADFSPDGALLVTTGNERVGPAGGACVWRLLPDGLERVTWLGSCGAPPGKRVTYRGVKFARTGGRLFVGANIGGEARVAAWRMTDWRLIACKRALSEPLTSLALSPPAGRLVAVGGADGSFVALAAGTLAGMTRMANAHMVFVTHVAFSPSGATLASISGDASVRCTPMPPPRSLLAAALRLLLVYLMLVATAALIVAKARGRL
jgi:WD40 repeat protein